MATDERTSEQSEPLTCLATGEGQVKNQNSWQDSNLRPPLHRLELPNEILELLGSQVVHLGPELDNVYCWSPGSIK